MDTCPAQRGRENAFRARRLSPLGVTGTRAGIPARRGLLVKTGLRTRAIDARDIRPLAAQHGRPASRRWGARSPWLQRWALTPKGIDSGAAG